MGRLTYNAKMTIDSNLSVQPAVSTASNLDRASSSTETQQILQSFKDTLRILLLTQLMSAWDSSAGGSFTNPAAGGTSMGLMNSMLSLYEQILSQQLQDGTLLTNPESGLGETGFHHINQFTAELQVGGDGRNANCGPTSLVMALHQLGLRVAGETANSNDGEAVDLARRSMIGSGNRDGVDANGNRVEAEHSTYTSFNDLARGAAAAGAQTKIVKASAAGIQGALQSGASVIVSGTFTGKVPLPWTGDRGIDNNSAPGGARGHLIEVSAYDPASNTFTVHDPARSGVVQVSAATLEHFMAGNAGAMALWK
jgi:hypothetical protein